MLEHEHVLEAVRAPRHEPGSYRHLSYCWRSAELQAAQPGESRSPRADTSRRLTGNASLIQRNASI